MLDYDDIFVTGPFSLDARAKSSLHRDWLSRLGEHHRRLCGPYDRLCAALGDSPALPVRLFKEHDLRSVEAGDVVKTMTSSGTTGQQVSRIYLDKATSARQSKALSKITSDFIGKQRLPMLVIDSASVLKDRALFSARGAGILGFSMLGRDVTYALDEGMDIDYGKVDAFVEKHRGRDVLLFGFTFMVWQHLCLALRRSERRLDLQGFLVHGGGWKKLGDLAVGNEAFRQTVTELTGIRGIHNYYGMVEQTGSIFMECEHGHLHASLFSDVDIFDPLTLRPGHAGRGYVCTTSLLPTSYPGHILLTEDEGELMGEDDCPCGRLGRYFRVFGRMPGAEIRGCSDTYAVR
ncbi:MAG: hypothetical protein LBL86_11760 [Coriobacteriales bacterium]|jgi:hypothetical protein|nr:hypothetical protein [Coriobacteriales bacterium]